MMSSPYVIVPERITQVNKHEYIREAVTANHAEFFTVYTLESGKARPVEDFKTYEAANTFVRSLMNL